ncbi:hypothetical protein [Prevotella fusca]
MPVKLFFNKLKEKFELQDDDYEWIKSKNSLITPSQIKLLNDEQEADFAGLMSDMIIVDEDINANEVAIYDVVAEFCGITISFEEATGNEHIAGCTKS